MNLYSTIVQWSDEDGLFLVTIPEFADRAVMPCTHGKTRSEAINNGEEVIEMYLEAWQAEGESIPEPRNLEVLKYFTAMVQNHNQYQNESFHRE
ncbi:MAG: type II toxin-antitoxin system HicB family antitoxin [Oscillatoriaceae cyanobacterium Prado104]|jgi:predicted RNase H-like HicB family nuclease|nr:type II toxin-antitoxin system HicB family antitoxin [Oscillatoriaceae cyanobacterium Prado104]